MENKPRGVKSEEKLMEQKLKYPLDLQFFSEEATDTEENQTESQEQQTEQKTFTQEDLNKIISERLGKEKAKWEKDYTAKIEEAKTEAEKLAKMKAEEKAKYQEQKRLEKLEQREKDITTRELKAQAYETLAEKGLPKDLIETLNFTDSESCNSSIIAVEKAFKSAVEKAVNEKLKGEPPKGSESSSSDTVFEFNFQPIAGVKK